MISCRDCLYFMQEMESENVDLIYADPPFFSNRDYYTQSGELAYSDIWKEGLSGYLAWLSERLREMHRLLKQNGTIYVHCDWRAGHYIKIEMDKIFGREHFRNEIVWCYSGGGIPKLDFPRKHDVIFRYSKGSEYKYYPDFRPYTAGTVKRGRTAVKGKYFDQGLRPEGTPMQDWWIDIPKITSPDDPEKLGYPTQKHTALLNRIIKCSSDEDDIIFDPFCGSGTTVVVAKRLGRKCIACDISPIAVRLTVNRTENEEMRIDAWPD